MIRHGETGYLVRSGDADDLRKGIEALVNDPVARARMADNGRRLVEERHGVAHHVSGMRAVYEEAIGIWRAQGNRG